jgi:hypothetical protein
MRQIAAVGLRLAICGRMAGRHQLAPAMACLAMINQNIGTADLSVTSFVEVKLRRGQHPRR